MGDNAAERVASSAGGGTDTVLAGPDVDDVDDVAVDPSDEDERHPDGAAPEEPVSEGSRVVQDAPVPSHAQMRVDFGAHLEANYRRLVAQLYAITLDPAEAHSAVQDAYSRAWRTWATVSRSPDSVGWVRRVAVRSTIRSWRRLRPRRAVTAGLDSQTGALLATLRELPAAERRCVVLHHMAGAPVQEIAAVEGASVSTTAARLARAQKVVSDGLPGLAGLVDDVDNGYASGHVNGYDGYDGEWDDAEYDDEYAADLDGNLDAGWSGHPDADASDDDGWMSEEHDHRRRADAEEDQR